MSIYKKEVRQSEEFKNSSQKTLQISRVDKKMISVEDVIKLANGLMEIGDKEGKKTSLLIRGMNSAGETTLKAFDEPIDSVEDIIDYYNNHVKSIAKFDHFYQLQVTITSYDKNIDNRKALGHYKVKPITEKKKISKEDFEKPVKKSKK